MDAVDYAAAGVAVRTDLKEAHREILEHVRGSGTWWTGAQRIAMAAEARQADRCQLCAERKAALSPGNVKGTHDTLSGLPANVVEVVHRVRTDPARLSRAWFDRMLASGLSAAEYVEIVGVVALLTGVDYFARSLGVAAPTLPEPCGGEPTRRRPPGARGGTAWVPMIAPEDATGPEAGLYGEAPVVPNIVRALSLVPDEVRALWRSSNAHYLPLTQIPDPAARRSLDRMQMELVAARVSALNQCFY
jgi:alkylhydroperoxidase family enzyme